MIFLQAGRNRGRGISEKNDLTLIKIYTMKNLLLLAFFIVSFGSFSQEKKTKETITIQTSAQCGMCKDRIEKTLAFTKGVKKSDLDVKTKSLSVVYNPGKITAEKIREVVSSTGYDADSVPADKNAYENLPACCKKGGHD